jgi:hypothetical protein
MRKLKDLAPRTTQGAIRATFMGNLELAQTDPAAATVETLAEDFENMALFREFVSEAPDDQMVNESGQFEQANKLGFRSLILSPTYPLPMINYIGILWVED